MDGAFITGPFTSLLLRFIKEGTRRAEVPPLVRSWSSAKSSLPITFLSFLALSLLLSFSRDLSLSFSLSLLWCSSMPNYNEPR